MRPFPSSCAIGAAILFAPLANMASAQGWLTRAIAPEVRSHDFGTVARAANTEHRFVITNVLDKDMHIRSVRTSCGCTTPIVETEWIKPGEKGTILARFNTGTFTGQKQATVTVTVDRPYFTELQLNVRGYIRSDVVLSPGEVRFGQVPEGEEKTIELTLDYAGRNDWRLEEISSPLPFVKAKFEELSRSGGRIKYKITAILTESASVGFVQNQFILRTNDRRLTTLPVRFNVSVQPAIQFSPQSLALGKLKPGEPVKQRLVVKSKKPFRILAITSETARVEFDPIKDAKPVHLINITLAPNAVSPEGKIVGHLLLKTDLNDAFLKLGLTYEVVKQSFTAAPAVVDAPD